MQANIQNVTWTLAILTLIGDISLVILILLLVINKIKKNTLIEELFSFIGQNNLLFSFVIAFSATFGSLFFSEIAKFIPCDLCWFQRVCMYSQFLILGLALYSRDKNIRPYIILLSTVGAIISVYNYYLQILPPVVSFCSSNGTVPCSQINFFYYGYITTPIMALTASLLIILFNYFSYWEEKLN